MIKMKKKSQIALFIVVAIMVLVSVIFLIWLSMPNLSKHLGASRGDDKAALKSSIEGCLQLMAEDWLFVHGLHTGNYEGKSATFGLNESDVIMPDIDTTKQQLKQFLKEHVGACIKQGLHGFNISVNNPEFEVLFTDSKTIIKHSDLYLAEKEDEAFSSGFGSFEISKRIIFVLDKATWLVNQRNQDRYIRGAKEFRDQEMELEVIRDNDNLEHWLITDNAGSTPYYFAFLVWLNI